MKIVVYHKKEYTGTGLYRLHFPHELMAKWGHHITFTDTTDIDDCDILICSKAWFKPIMDVLPDLKKRGIVTIIDFDDYWNLHHGHLLEANYKHHKTSFVLVDAIREFDYVTCTTEILRKEIKPLNKNVEVFENAIDENDPQFLRSNVPSDNVRFGWIGGHCHLPDIKLLDGTPQKLQGNFSISLFGHDQVSGGVYDYFAKILSGEGKLIPDKFFVYNQAKARQYTRYYNYIDVALVPLVGNHFNSMKSELKIVEAGMMRKACVVSNVEPYRSLLTDSNCLKVSVKPHWKKRMQKLINNPALVEDLGEAMYETVKDKFDLITVTRRREQWYKTLI